MRRICIQIQEVIHTVDNLLLILICVASSIRLQRNSSGSGDSFRDKRHDSDHSDTDSEALDLSAIRRARLQHPGTISMFGSISARGAGKDAEDEVTANEENLRNLFDLPASEKIITGMNSLQRNVLVNK